MCRQTSPRRVSTAAADVAIVAMPGSGSDTINCVV
jgi:hypothetical protein